MAVAVGGLESRYTQGVIIFVFARCTVLPLPWRPALPTPLACVLAYPLALAAATPFSATLHAQWADRAAVGTLLDNMIFVLASVGVAIFGSHVIARAERRVEHARRLGKYRLKARIGRGAAGDVWLARQLPLERDVALKVLRDHGSGGDEAMLRFQREAQAASRLEHPNTIRIYDYGASDDGVFYISMELLTGMDLDVFVDLHGALDPARAVYVARQICGSLAEAHALGIVHRDVKPANVFLAQVGDDHDVVKVLDFGVAHLADPAGSVTETGTLFGTPDFMAPEICGGDKADARSDVYSVGATLYFMLTGAPLFPGRTVGEVLMAQLSRPPDALSARAKQPIDADLEAVVMRCLEKEPSARWPGVAELERALAACACAPFWTKEDSRAWWDAVTTAPRKRAG
jgi:serine/threonine-protein kinase